MIPTLFPVYDYGTRKLRDGTLVETCAFCKGSIEKRPECNNHYASLVKKSEGYYQCPFGFTTRTFYFDAKLWAVTGVVAFPRFNTDAERSMAKKYPGTKVARESIEHFRELFSSIDSLRAASVQAATAVIPQAFHELRKLNGAVIQHAERELKANNSPALTTIKSAAELMRNNFDILEALSNIEGMRALPVDGTICVYDLVYKTQRVFLERAKAKGIEFALDGVRAIIRGSPKSFPIVPAVLLENAIKYGRPKSMIRTTISTVGKMVDLIVENESAYSMDREKCFERGSRYAVNAAEGGGFGLFLAKEIVSAHDGTIRCELAEGIVRMIVRLPLEKVIS
jgi:signal transduction histidine kinase